ncbi:hypothetical protein Cgig2_014967 [Carnegiea gigantea]|uniref:Uncharacterized protein n=1 Tax=Carnegiea gigantea TaxID=171969 RepID=A0A9Q1GI28_9CARY|nr:hypothetical protein Cgig2_014967 [Carnegiea gigantea]
MEWIGYGDDNTMTFFARAKQRKLASYIYQIRDTKGNLVEGFDRVGQTMMTFYKALLGEQNTIRQIITQEVVNQGPTLSKEQQVHMGNEFTDLEIKEAIFSIPNTKSPGHDGFSGGFFKTTWQKISPLICSAITRWHRLINGNRKPKGKYSEQSSFGQDQMYQGMHSSHGC